MKVLDVLEQHAKDSISELSKRCGLSSQKVARIIKNLEKKKLIWGYSAIADGTVTAPRDKSRGFTAPVVPDLDNHRGRIVAVVDF